MVFLVLKRVTKQFAEAAQRTLARVRDGSFLRALNRLTLVAVLGSPVTKVLVHSTIFQHHADEARAADIPLALLQLEDGQGGGE